MNRWDETWHRLREWTNGQAPSERLAAQLLLADGFSDVKPSHPLGGPDGGKDAIATKDGKEWVMAVYFPRGKQSFSKVRHKFRKDHQGTVSHDIGGLVFVTNQELTLSQRAELCNSVPTAVELYDLERVTTLLDQPAMYGVSSQFLGIDKTESSIAELLKAQTRLEGLQTGGDTFCYLMLYHFDLQEAIAHNFVVARKGEFPLYDVRLRIVDMDRGVDIVEERWGELHSPASYKLVRWSLRDAVYYRIFFDARNGDWTQDLQLRKSVQDECWLAATRVRARRGEIRLEHIDGQFIDKFGQPGWRS